MPRGDPTEDYVPASDLAQARAERDEAIADYERVKAERDELLGPEIAIPANRDLKLRVEAERDRLASDLAQARARLAAVQAAGEELAAILREMNDMTGPFQLPRTEAALANWRSIAGEDE